MVLSELIALLKTIQKTHPDAKTATVWAGRRKQITSVGLDNKHKPIRIRLE